MNAILNRTPASNSIISDMFDEFCDLHEQVKAFETIQKRYDQLKKLLADHASQVSSDEVRLAGQIGYVSFTKPPMVRAINDVTKFFDAVGVESFIQSVTVSTTKADKLLSASQKAELFTVTEGSRRLKDCGRISTLLFGGLSSVSSLK
jgi:hypothetical protein